MPGLEHALALAWNGDNKGPHTVEEALAIIKQLKVRLVCTSTYKQPFSFHSLHKCVVGSVRSKNFPML